jgi:hypothetical protein
LNQKTGTTAILSIIAAVVSYYATLTGSPIVGFLLALVSIPLGITGMFKAASPRVSGGIISIFAIGMGAVGMIVAMLAVIGLIVF